MFSSVRVTALRTDGWKSRIGTIFEPIGSILIPDTICTPLVTKLQA